jgi:hypothetical protein
MELRRRLDSDGHLRLDVPVAPASAEIDIVLVINPLPGQPGPGYDFSDLVGRLEWRGNAVEEQRKLRDEWR